MTAKWTPTENEIRAMDEKVSTSQGALDVLQFIAEREPSVSKVAAPLKDVISYWQSSAAKSPGASALVLQDLRDIRDTLDKSLIPNDATVVFSIDRVVKALESGTISMSTRAPGSIVNKILLGAGEPEKSDNRPRAR